MESVELEESIEMRCTLYEQFAYEDEYETRPAVMSLSNDERRKQRERDKEDFLEWLWLSPLAGGLAGDVGRDELNRLREFAKANGLVRGRDPHYRELEELIKDAVEDDLIVPVIDRTDEFGSGYIPPATNPQTSWVSDGLLRAPGGSPASSFEGFANGAPIPSGLYDPPTQGARMMAARASASGGAGAAGGGPDWRGVAAAAGGAILSGAAGGQSSSDALGKSFGGGDASGSLLGDAQPFGYQSSDIADDMQTAWLPSTDGPPNSWLENPSGKMQWRYYDGNGNAAVDIDFGHDHGFGAPHSHNWENGKRDKGNPVSTF